MINALTRQTLGVPLFNFSKNPLLAYPAAENTDAYNKAHGELYRILIDAVSADCLERLSAKRGVTLSDSRQRMNNLKQLLPDDLVNVVWKPIKQCYDERNRRHDDPGKQPERLPAFEVFHADLKEIQLGLAKLREWLEQLLDADAAACLRRIEAMEGLFPKLVGPPRPQDKLAELQRMVGKTVASVEFGEEQPHPECHEAEGMIVHFTDGSSMAIRIGSNAGNLQHELSKMKPQDFHADLMVFWAPAIVRKTEKVKGERQ